MLFSSKDYDVSIMISLLIVELLRGVCICTCTYVFFVQMEVFFCSIIFVMDCIVLKNICFHLVILTFCSFLLDDFISRLALY